ncbi:MAG: MerC mercury resistance protein [Myxococcaceae bacterium]|nr:MerC mercury resistance protein [Myxococcaceae bacterium]
MPVAISVMPLLGASGVTHFGPTAELVMTLLVVASALAGVSWGYRRHRDTRIVFATVLGLLAYLLGHAYEPSWYGMGLAVLGALTLAGSSFMGARLTHASVHPSCAS